MKPMQPLMAEKKWSELFTATAISDVNKSSPAYPLWEEHQFNDHLIQEWCQVRAGSDYPLLQGSLCNLPYFSLNVTPSPAVLACLRESLIYIENDRTHFEAILFNDWVNIHVKYDKIIGGRLLAVVPLSEFPYPRGPLNVADDVDDDDDDDVAATSDDAKAVLRECIVTECSVTLPPREVKELPRPLYTKVANILKKLGGKWSTKEQAFTFRRNPKDDLQKYLSGNALKNVKKELQAFFTPKEVCEKMMEMAQLFKGCSVLEPSAGDGNLVEAMLASEEGETLLITAVELDDLHFKDLQERVGHSARMFKADFLTWKDEKDPEGYDRVVMNPPFTKGQDAKHVLHALELLTPGGMLVTVMPPASLDKRTGPYKKLWESVTILDRVDLPRGAFKASGTVVETCLVKMVKNS